MASFFRLWQKLCGVHGAERGKSSPARLAHFELLEQRNLLTGSMPASLVGTVVVDRTDDGVTDDDLAIAGAVVRLFRDGGDGLFDAGQADDELLDSRATDGAGHYRFEGLTQGTYFVQQLPASGLLQRPSATVQQVVITAADLEGEMRTPIDTFETTQMLEVASFGSRLAASTRGAAEALGGERDMFTELTSEFGRMQFSVNGYGAPVLQFDSSATAEGRRLVTWDGRDGNALLTDYVGLGGYDLTEGGSTTGIQLSFGADHSFGQITLRVFTDQSRWSQVQLDIPATGSRHTAPTVMAWSDFVAGGGEGADFAQVGAIQLEIEGDAAIDGRINRIDTFGPRTIEADFLNLQPLSLGNQIWYDADNDGTFAPGIELGISQVAVKLYLDSDGNGNFSAADTLLAEELTADDGTYRFDQLLPGDYLIKLAAANFAPGGPLAGMVLTTGAIATDPDDDIDHDNNGWRTSDGAAVTAAVSLASLAEPMEDGDGNANTNLTVDVGLTSFDLSISKSDSRDPAIAGQLLTYTVVVTNHSSAQATGVTATDKLPAGVSFVSAASSQGTVQEADGIVTASLGSLAAGATATVTIEVDVPSGQTAPLLNVATVAGNEPESNLDNNRAEEPTTVRGLFDLEVVKTDSVDPVTAGEALTYTIVVRNHGPSDAQDVVMIDDLPDEVTFVSAQTTQGTLTEADGRVRAQLGYLAAGQSETVTILVTVGLDVVDEIENVTIVDGNPVQVDPSLPGTVIKESNLENNIDDELTLVEPALSSISGYVYVDLNNDGQRGPSEPPIGGVEIQLSGTDVVGNTVSRVDVTDNEGFYRFSDLLPGHYSVKEVQPAGFRDGIDTPGMVAGGTGLLQYTVHDDLFAGIGLAGGVDAVEFNFGELMHRVSKRDYLASTPDLD